MKIAKKLISLLMLVSALLALCIVASATGGQTNLNAKLSATEAKVGDKITLTISNCDMTAEAIKAGFYFDNTKLEVEKITWSHIVAYSEDEEDDVNNFATSQTSKKKANESGTALGVYAICSGVDSECYEGVIVTVVFNVIAEGEAKITLREETVGTDAFKSDSVETLTITIGGSAPACEHKDESKYTYASNAGKLTHKVTCDCGEVVTASENCSFNNEGKCTKCGYECLHTNENDALMFTEGKCDLCGYVCRHGEDHMGSSPVYIQMDNGKHNVKTTCDCGVLVEDYIEDCRDDYTYIDDTNIEQPDGICDCCEKEMPCEHSSFRYDINNDGTHTKYCDDCDTPIEGETNVEHTYGDKCTCVCGATNHEYTYACDQYCKNCEELTNEDAAHSVIHVEAKAPTCTENGNIEYWYCEYCGSAWLDAECTMVTNLQSVKLGATCAANAIHSEGVEAGCHYTGWTENWYCANCDVYYLDADCTIITNYKSLTIPALQDTAEYVPAKAPTCVENGNIEYWTCYECEQMWLDEALTQLTNKSAVKLGATCATNAIHNEGYAAKCHEAGLTEHWYCANCDVYYLNAECTIITNEKSLVIPAENQETICVDNGDGTHTKKYACCGAVIATDEHSYVMGECYYCENVCDHSHGFSGVRYTTNGDGTHKLERQCDSCYLFIVVNEKEACSGGTATCTAQAVCVNCSTAYGEKDADNHTEDPVYTYKDAYEHTATYSCCEVTVDEEHKQSEICTDCQAILVRVMLVREGQIHIVFADKDGNLETELPASELKRLYMVSANGSTNAGSGLVGDDNIISLTNLTANAVITVVDFYTGTVITNGATMSEQLWAIHEMYGLKQTENGHETFMSATGSAILSFEHYSKEGFELDYVLVNGTKYELGGSCEITADGFVIELVWKCLHTTTEYVDNGNGTHSEVCGTCGEKVGEPDAHAYDTINHKCVCDKVEEFILTVIDMKGNIHTDSVPFGTDILEAIKAMNGIDISSKKVNSDTMIGEYIFAAWVYANGEADVAKDDTVVGNVTIKPMTSANGWMKYQNGWQYHNNGAVVNTTWMEIDGAWYYFDANGFRAEGLTRVPYPEVTINGITYAANAADKAYWEAHKDTSKYSDATTAVFYFGADGKFVQYSGIEGKSYFINGMAPWHVGFVKNGNDYYYFVGDKDNGGNTMATGKIYATRDYNSKMTCEGKIYFFGADGKLLQNNEGEIKDGKYYLNGELAIGLGVVQLMDENGESYFIYVRSNGELATGEYWPTTRNGLLASGRYDFGEDGRLYWNVSADYTGIKDGIYYKNGRPFYAGLIEIGGATYYINSKCEVVTGWYYVTKTNEIEIPTTKLFFGEDGKLQPVKDGIVKESDVLYYYENNHLKCGAGVVEMTDAQGNTYYIYVKSNGQLATGEYWPTTTNGLLKNAKYDWGTDGKYYPAN